MSISPTVDILATAILPTKGKEDHAEHVEGGQEDSDDGQEE